MALRSAKQPENDEFDVSQPFTQKMQLFRRVVVKVDLSRRLACCVEEHCGTVLKINVEREEVFVYLDGGNCDWFQFQKVFIDTQTKTPQHVTERAIPLNSQIPKVNTTAASFFLQCVMRYYAKKGEIPEVRDLKKHQVVPLNSHQGTYLKVISVRDSLYFVSSNCAAFNRIWLFSGSLLFESVRKMYRKEHLIKPGDRAAEKVFFETRPCGYEIELTLADCQPVQMPVRQSPRCYQARFDARKYMLSQFDELPEIESPIRLDRGDVRRFFVDCNGDDRIGQLQMDEAIRKLKKATQNGNDDDLIAFAAPATHWSDDDSTIDETTEETTDEQDISFEV